MGKSKETFFSKRKKEHFTKEAQKEDVRARSYFKLKHINEHFSLLKEGQKILDLGSAPGSWLEYCDRLLKSATIIGIDLLEIKKLQEFSEKVRIIQDDFNEIKEYNLGNFDIILSDMAPEFSGDSRIDRGRTHKLNISTLEFCETYLKKEGTLVFKSFEGEDLGIVREKAKKLFKYIKEYKPQSSQKKSAEIYVICQNKL